jgi:hypothetical protein
MSSAHMHTLKNFISHSIITCFFKDRNERVILNVYIYAHLI